MSSCIHFFRFHQLKEGIAVLVLSRKSGEKIHVGEQIVITVLELKGNRVVLGLDAPDDCEILRGELYEVQRRPWREVER
jgi:carbon storage regulator CsrA